MGGMAGRGWVISRAVASQRAVDGWFNFECCLLGAEVEREFTADLISKEGRWCR